MDDLHQLRVQAKRLQRYSERVKAGIWTGTREDLLTVLADCAEAGEIARRLYCQLQQHTATPPLQDETK